MPLISALLTIATPDAAIRRRCRLTIIIALALTALGLVASLLVFLTPDRVVTLASIGVGFVVYASAIVFARQGRATLAGGLLISVVLLGTAGNLISPTTTVVSLFFLALPVLLASVLLRPNHVWAIVAAMLLIIVGFVAARPPLLAEPNGASLVAASGLFIAIVAVVGFLGARETDQALATAAAHARDLSQAQERSAAQAASLAEQAAALAEAEQMQRALVAQLETPTVGLADGVVLAPLIGAMDSRRAQLLTERLLHQVNAQRSRLLVLDLTGVAVIDTAVAHKLLQLVQAVRLLGCEVVLTGISATVASTITMLGISLNGVQTLRSPQDVLLRHIAG